VFNILTMKLTVQSVAVNRRISDLFEVGQKVSLSNNGNNLRVFSLERNKAQIELISPTYIHHADDEETEIEIQGFIRAQNNENWDSVRIYLV
jgi:hypothetical protein